ncbi:serine hydrolase domain-containing protein [Amycolatopsis pithecellobii]|uniref:Serine hydrolase n=1 Tax=Amycolatopsis pithecellobii TaxID=664692 RepID=A0A6N7ZBJ5_9PSEU|nr:serine hydrolase domain-containing protein [Amycolatopsis pithecellobii]MTD59136.1 serine hydrolase [Amycolatopsis pithecellobii]
MGSALEKAMDEVLSRGEAGLQIAAYHQGKLVIDAQAGDARAGGKPVDAGTVFWVASAGKVSTATALHRQVERGLLRYDQTISSIWPEFGAWGKESFTVRDALTHRVGLAGLPADVTPERLGDWEWMTDRLARSAPSADPAEHDSYHALTWGYLVGEIVRRADPAHRSFEEFVRDEVLAPAGITDLWHRLPASVHGRAAVVKGDIFAGDFVVTEDHEINTAEYRVRFDPSGAWMTARAGARLWALYAQGGQLDGPRLLSAERIRTFLEPRTGGYPAGPLVGPHGVIGQGALMLGGEVPSHADVLGFGRSVLWHPGAGGALGFADLDAELAGMICHNQLFDARGLAQHPFAPVVRAIYAEVDA